MDKVAQKVVWRSAGLILLLLDILAVNFFHTGSLDKWNVILHIAWALLAGLLMFGEKLVEWIQRLLHEWKGHDAAE